MQDFDFEILSNVTLRLGTVLATFSAAILGFAIRYSIRTAGWSRLAVRLATLLTWAAVIAIPMRPFFAGSRDPATRGIYIALAVLAIAALNGWAFGGVERAQAAARARPRGRMALVRAVNDIFADLPNVQTPEDRARIDADLASLDRYVEPATFEFVQLARSRAISWLDGGPRAEAREARWSARMQELADQVTPPWRPDRFTKWEERIRAHILPSAMGIAVVAGFVVGRSVLAGPIALTAIATIVLGYLLTWRWDRAAAPALVAAAVGLAVTGILQSGLREPGAIRTAMVCAVLLVVIAVLERRRGLSARRLRVIDGVGSPSSPPTSTDPRAS